MNDKRSIVPSFHFSTHGFIIIIFADFIIDSRFIIGINHHLLQYCVQLPDIHPPSNLLALLVLEETNHLFLHKRMILK